MEQRRIFDFDNDGYKDLFAACGAIDDNVEEFSHRNRDTPNRRAGEQGNGRFADAVRAPGADFSSRPASRRGIR